MEESTDFFLIVGLGLEELAEYEFKAKWECLHKMDPQLFQECPRLTREPGGLAFSTSTSCGWILNHYLKIPTRILQRLTTFTSRDFPKLYNRLRKLPWHMYLRQGSIEFKTSATQSRLKIKDRLEKTCKDAIDESRKHQELRKAHLKVPQTVFVRVDNDEVTVSIDTSGDALYLRGYKTYSVDAPIRETLAAALFAAVLKKVDQIPAAVLDPMCGSGTLVFEALSFWQASRSRHFAYQNFPSAKPFSFDVKRDLPIEPISHGEGWDINVKAFEASEMNSAVFQKKFSQKVRFRQGNCFEEKIQETPRPLLAMINPPYDERLSANPKQLEKDLERFIENNRPDWIGIFWPGQSPPNWGEKVKWKAKIPAKNGGIPVTLAVGVLSK